MERSLQAIYDEFADAYESNRGAFDTSAILNAFYAGLNTGKGELLDLGCGAGEPVARYFIANGWRVTGVDFSARMLELAKKFAPEMATLHADIMAAAFEPGRFDAVTATYCLFHIAADRHADLFARIHRWLKPGGKVLFTYATKEYTGSERFDGYKEFLGRQLFYSHKTPEELYRDLAGVGFMIESGDYRDIGGETFLWLTARKPA